MQLNNQVSLNKFTLNISGTSNEGINFNKGEILKGQVQEIKENGLVSIFIKGKLIEALSEVMVNKGQQLFLMVDDMKDGRVVLKVIPPELLGKIENANLAATLKEIGLPPEQMNLQMAKKLIQHNLPVTAETLKNMAKGVNLLGEATPKNLEIVGTAMANNAPLTKPALSSLASFAENKTNLAQVTKELITILSKFENLGAEPKLNLSNLSPNPAEPKLASSNLASNPGAESKAPLLNLPPNTGASAGAAEASRLGSEPLNLNNQSPAAANPLSNTMGGDVQLSSATARVLNLLNQVLSTVVLPVNTGNPENQRQEIIEAIRTNLANDKELIRGLSLIKEFLAVQKEVPGLEKAVASSMIKTIEEMEQEFTGSRLLNVMTKFSGDNNLNYYYLSFPVKVNEEYRLCQLKIDKNISKPSLKDMDNIKFVVSLETGNLGLVLFHVDWYKSRMLKLQGVVETPEVLQHITGNINMLINALKAQGYTVDYQGIKVAPTSLEPMRLQLQETTEVVKPFVIDIRV